MTSGHGLSQQTVAQITRVLTEFPDVEKAVLFGSRAKERTSAARISISRWPAPISTGRRSAASAALSMTSLSHTGLVSSFGAESWTGKSRRISAGSAFSFMNDDHPS
jgi:hypothetical protein